MLCRKKGDYCLLLDSALNVLCSHEDLSLNSELAKVFRQWEWTVWRVEELGTSSILNSITRQSLDNTVS